MNTQLELPLEEPSSIDKAREIIYGDREKTYGSPDKNLTAIATMWSAYMTSKFNIKVDINAKDVCVLMSLLKAARFANDQTHSDNIVDAIGYWALIERCNTEEVNNG